MLKNGDNADNFTENIFLTHFLRGLICDIKKLKNSNIPGAMTPKAPISSTLLPKARAVKLNAVILTALATSGRPDITFFKRKHPSSFSALLPSWCWFHRHIHAGTAGGGGGNGAGGASRRACIGLSDPKCIISDLWSEN